MYATLMVHLELGRPNTNLLKVSGALIERLHTSVVGVAVCQPMRIIYNDGYVPAELIDQDRQQIADEMKAAEAEFHAAFRGRAQTAEWRSAVTHLTLAAQLASEARCADLVITGIDGRASLFDTSRQVDIGDFVMQAGRPCLIIPPGVEQLNLEHTLVGWKDTGETRRAVYDALPLLKQSGHVTVAELSLDEDLMDVRTRLQDVVGWLKRHGIEANAVAAPSTGDDATGLKAIAQEQRVDLIVAGAYGHSRVREWVLGGVTRDLLLRGGPPALVSH
jgi:nucleotide-binding universal stress UspA family protein